jgi:L-ribulose-5-phosphate 3-epimerase
MRANGVAPRYVRFDPQNEQGGETVKKYALGLYEKAMPPGLSWEEKLSFAKSCGYDFVEISIDEKDDKLARLDWTADERRELADTMSRVGLPLRSMCLSGHRKYPFGAPDPAVRARSMEIMEKAIQLADDLGIRIIQLAGYDVYYEESSAETKAAFLDNLRRATEMASVKGISLGFETMETDFMNTVWKAMYYVKLVGSPWLGVYPDSGNLTNAALSSGGNVLDDLESGRGHIVALHLKETVPGVFREVPFLTGHVNFPAVIEKAWSMGIRRYVTEMWYVGNDGTWADDIRFARKSMGDILDKQ